MHLILLNSILLLLLPNPTLQATVTIATSRPIFDPHRWAAQTCSYIAATQCCMPLDLNVLGLGHGWFRAMNVQFSQLPPVPLHLSVWRAQGTGYSCGGPTLGDVVSYGEPSLEYSNALGVGGGAWYTMSNANKTIVATSAEVVFPDRIVYGGAIYKEVIGERGIFQNPIGDYILGVPFIVGPQQPRKPTISNDLSGAGWQRLEKPNLIENLFGDAAGRVGYNATPVSAGTSK